MFDQHDSNLAAEAGQTLGSTASNGQASEALPHPAPEDAQPATERTASASSSRHALAGRKGAHRVHQLIEEGRLYEQEHGLKSGRQRLRQLIELGKLYELEHGLRPRMRRK